MLLRLKVTVSFKCLRLCEILSYSFQKIDEDVSSKLEWLAVNFRKSIVLVAFFLQEHPFKKAINLVTALVDCYFTLVHKSYDLVL